MGQGRAEKESCEVMARRRHSICNGRDAMGVGDARDNHGDEALR